MGIENLHPLYVKRAPQWEVIRDCVEGESAVKSKGELYLPRLAGSNNLQYEGYKKRARWNNYTARNLDGLHGFIFRRSPVIKAPEEFKKTELFENIDRKGTTLYQFLSDTVYDVMQTSFGGYLIDYPKAEGVMTVGEAEKKGIRPYLRYYPAESIINWGYSVINGVEQLSFVVLKENVEDYIDDEFTPTVTTQYRVLDARSGKYQQRIFKKLSDKEKYELKTKEDYLEFEVIDVTVNGNSLTELPFVLLPTDKPEKPMFYDLAMCNIGHYQKTADYENGVHLTTIPTGYVTGHRQQEYEDGSREVIHLGWDSFLMFEEADAKVGNLSFSGVGLVHSEEAIKQSLADMAILGSRLLASEKGVSESADSAKIHRAGENATLATFAKNVSERITKVLNIMARWLGISGKIEIALCTDYDTLAFDPNALNAIANLAEAKKFPAPYVFWNLKNGEYIPSDSSYEEYAALLALEESGATALELAEIWSKIQNGEDLSKLTKNINNKPPVQEDKDEVVTE